MTIRRDRRRMQPFFFISTLLAGGLAGSTWLAGCSEQDAEPPVGTALQALGQDNASYCATHASRPAPVADAAKWAAFQQAIELPGGGLATSVESARTAWGATGLSIVVLEDYGKTQEGHWGFSDQSAGRLTSSATYYHSASITKMVSGLVFAGAHRRGDINIYESATSIVNRHLGTLLEDWRDQWFTGAEASYPDDITIRRLITHTAGLNHHGIGVQNLNNLQTFDDVLMGSWFCRSLGLCGAEEATRPIHEPRTVFDYSGGSFILAELMLQLETGSSFESYAESNVLTPILGAGSISKFDTASPADINLANPGTIKGSNLKSAGALLANPAEYATIVELVLNDGVDRGCNTVIPHDDIELLLTPIHHEDSSKAACSSNAQCSAPEECVLGKCKELIQDGSSDYGLGVALGTSRGSDGLPKIFEHGGDDGDYQVGNGFRGHRAKGTGIVVFVHGGSSPGGLENAIENAYRCVYEGDSSACGGHANGTPCNGNSDCASGNCEATDWWGSGAKVCNAAECGIDGWDSSNFNDGVCSNDCRAHNQQLCPSDQTCTQNGCVPSCNADADCPGDHPYCVYGDSLKALGKLCSVANCSQCQWDETPNTAGCTGTFGDGDPGDCGASQQCYGGTCRSPGTCSGICNLNDCSYVGVDTTCNPGFTPVEYCPVGCNHVTNATCECVW